MRGLTSSTLLICILFISACSPPPPPPPPKATVFDPLLQDEQRARDVQKTVNEQAEKSRQSVDDQERGDKSP